MLVSYVFSMCQAMPTGLYSSCELGSESGKYKPRQNKTRSFENMVMSYFQRVRPQCKVESFYTTSTQKKVIFTMLKALVDTTTLCLKLWGCCYHYCPCQDSRPSLTEEEILRGIRKRELDELWEQKIQEKGYSVTEMYECDWWNMYKTSIIVRQDLHESFSYRNVSLRRKIFGENQIWKSFLLCSM